MRKTLHNSHFQFEIDNQVSSWSLYDLAQSDIALNNVRMQFSYHINKTFVTGLENWQQYHISHIEAELPGLNKSEAIILGNQADLHGVKVKVFFTLHPQFPLFLWKVEITNMGDIPIKVNRIDMLHIGNIKHLSKKQQGIQSFIDNIGGNLAFFSNGWGSWNYTATYGADDKYQRTRLSFIHTPMQVNAGTPQPSSRGVFASDMFGILGSRDTRKAFLAGFLSQKQHFGSLLVHLNHHSPSLQLWANGDDARLDPGKTIQTDWACIQFVDIDSPAPLAPYLIASAQENQVSQKINESAVPTGWCSWYMFYQDISKDKIIRNTAALRKMKEELPLELIQIDDGFQTAIGDWLTVKDTFPDGMKSLATEIRQNEFTPGLWLAPFIVDPRSQLAKEHSDWLLRGKFNRPVNAGFTSWGVFATALDITKPAAMHYVQEVIHTAVKKWGYPYLKLDFLYAASLPGHYNDSTKTRAQVLRQGLQTIREIAGQDTYLLGCGCPIGSAIGIVDAMRIGPDVDERWNPSHQGIEFFFDKEPDLPSVRNSIHNIITRAFTHRRWWINDPDTLLLRDTTKLTLAEIQSLATAAALSGGSLLISDDIPSLSPERIQIVKALFPLIKQIPTIPDWFDSQHPEKMQLDLQNETGNWTVLGNFNWSDAPKQMQLNYKTISQDPNTTYFAREFWTGKTWTFNPSKPPTLTIPPHGVALLSIRTIIPDIPTYLGSEIHISQGLEVRHWKVSPQKISLQINKSGTNQGNICLQLPRLPQEVLLNSNPIFGELTTGGHYSLQLQFRDKADIHIAL